ncbi:MAG: hypothetical protein AB7I27_16815 [Bacteriovoracaceae bacterium]
MGLFFYATLSGALFFVALLVLGIFLVISGAYYDSAVLFLLGARGIRASNDNSELSTTSKQVAYNFSLPQPRLYFYNGNLGRAFVLQKGRTISLVLDKELLNSLNKEELFAICFILLIQVKKGLAKKRSRALFFIGMNAWIVHSFTGLIARVLPNKEIKQSLYWFINYLLQPYLMFLSVNLIGMGYFKKLEGLLSHFPQELKKNKLMGLKLNTASFLDSLSSRKLLELMSIQKSQNFQLILSLETLPHEFDYIFREIGLVHDK